MTTDVKTPAAEPSAAPTQFDSWDDKGNPIVSAKRQEAPTKQDSAPAAKPKSEVSETSKQDPPEGDESESASEAGADNQSHQERNRGKKLTADERIQQLEATIERIKRDSGKSQTKETKSAEPSTAKAPEPPPFQFKPTRPEPKEEDLDGNGKPKYASYTDFIKDLGKWSAEQEHAQREQKRQTEEGMRAMQQRIDEAKTRYPDKEVEKIIHETGNTIYQDARVPDGLKAIINQSEVFTDLLYTLGSDPKEFQDFLKLAQTDPLKALRKVVITEQLVSEELAKSKNAKPEKSAEAGGEKKETKAPEELKPRAPKPPSEVGGRDTAPDDALVTAARANDFRAFEAEQTRRVLASRK